MDLEQPTIHLKENILAFRFDTKDYMSVSAKDFRLYYIDKLYHPVPSFLLGDEANNCVYCWVEFVYRMQYLRFLKNLPEKYKKCIYQERQAMINKYWT